MKIWRALKNWQVAIAISVYSTRLQTKSNEENSDSDSRNRWLWETETQTRQLHVEIQWWQTTTTLNILHKKQEKCFYFPQFFSETRTSATQCHTQYTAQNTWHAMLPYYSKSTNSIVVHVVHFKRSSHLEISVHSFPLHQPAVVTIPQTFSEGLRCWRWKQVLYVMQSMETHCRCSNISLTSKILQLRTFWGRAEIDEVLAISRSDCTASISWCRHLLIHLETALQSCKNIWFCVKLVQVPLSSRFSVLNVVYLLYTCQCCCLVIYPSSTTLSVPSLSLPIPLNR